MLFDLLEVLELFEEPSEYDGIGLTIIDSDMQDKADELFTSDVPEPSEDEDFTGDDA